jgi:hypothetical protein
MRLAVCLSLLVLCAEGLRLRPHVMRRRFVRALGRELVVVWPILFGLVIWQLFLGVLVSLIERWRLGDALYFTYVTGLTIGYGDLVPRHALSRILSALIALSGVLLMGLVAAIGVKALQSAASDQ